MKFWLFLAVFVAQIFANEPNLEAKFNEAQAKFESGDEQDALKIWLQACEQNHGASCRQAGAVFLKRKDEKNGKIYILKACKLNDDIACAIEQILAKGGAVK